MWPFRRKTESKASATGVVVSAHSVGQPVWTERRFDKLADEGYRKCIVAYRCVREIGRGVASVPWTLTNAKTKKEIEEHPLLTLLQHPSPGIGGASFIENWVGFHQLAGNSYVEAVGPNTSAPPKELHALRPDRMKIIPGAYGLPGGFEYEANGRKVKWDADPITGESDILHMKDFNPLDDWYGMSPIEAAAFSIDQHNAAGAHNAALLQNGARPSGALVFEPVIDKLTGKAEFAPPELIAAAEARLLERQASPRNAGKPLVLGGQVRWIDLMLSPHDMDFLNMKLTSAREICSAFGVPHVLVVPGEATFNNRADARLELWENTIIPHLDRMTDALNTWLTPRFGDHLRLGYDLDEVSALEPRRETKWKRAIDGAEAGILTINEAREAIDYDEHADGNRFIEKTVAPPGAPKPKAPAPAASA